MALANVSTVAFIAGGVLLAGGLTLFFVAPRSKEAVGVSIGPGSVSIGGAF
jgi:hypothetical protein